MARRGRPARMKMMRPSLRIFALAFLAIQPLLGPGAARAAGLSDEIRKGMARYDPLVRRIAGRYIVDPALVHSIIAAESAYDRFAVSTKGAQGLMQLMPETARDYGVDDSFDIAQNIEGGVKYLRDLQKAYPGKTELVLAAYHAGPKAVARFEGVPPYSETVTYVARVKDYYRRMAPSAKTRIIETMDKNGLRIVTNDPRLAYR